MDAVQQKTDEQFTLLQRGREQLRARATQLQQDIAGLQRRKDALRQANGGEGVNPQSTARLKLNIGGTRLLTTRAILTQFPNTRLAALFNGCYENKLTHDQKKRIFLDVDPGLFNEINQWLIACRNASAPGEPLPELPEVDSEDKEAFERLLQFFGITDIVSPPLAGLDSNILTNEVHVEQLSQWVEMQGSQLLYRASRDGWGAADFHARCDNQGPTVTIVRTANGNLFGGFADQPWHSNGSWIHSNAAFLFTLRNSVKRKGVAPTKLPLSGGRSNQHAMYGHPNYGPTFGAAHDLHISNLPNSNDSSTSIGNTYKIPPGQNGQTILAGSSNFRVSELEVFSCSGIAQSSSSSRPSAASAAEAWETDSCEALVGTEGTIAKTLKAERKALRRCIQEHEQNLALFALESEFVKFFELEPEDIVTLNLGIGDKICTKRSTLMQCADSMLAQKFDKEKWAQPEAGDSDDSEDEGELIQQDAYCFKKMVNQLRLLAIAREDDPPPPPMVKATKRGQFEKLLTYYFPEREEFIGVGSSFDSAILQPRHGAQVLKWLDEAEQRGRMQLLYRASRDGWRAANFHTSCDNQGPTVTIVRTANGNLFGGFADQPWHSNGSWIHSNAAFLFTLVNQAGLAPTKLPLTGQSNQHAIYGQLSYGPTFGAGHDLHISDCPNSNNSTCSTGNSYTIPPSQNGQTILAGSSSFRVSELEVFSCSA